MAHTTHPATISTFSSIILFCCMTLGVPDTANAQTKFLPPPTKRVPLTETIFGKKVADDFRWLEDGKNDDVVAWTRAQHDATHTYMKSAYPEVAGLRDELTALYDRNVTNPPFFKADREFFYRRLKGNKHSKVFTRLNGKEILLFDVEQLDPTGNTSMSGFQLDRKAERVAIGIQVKGTELTDYLFLDTKTGKELYPRLTGVSGFGWCADPAYCYITPRTKELVDAQKPLPVWLHKFGTNRSTDVMLLTSDDAKISSYVYDSELADVTVMGKGDFYSGTVMFRKTGTTDAPRTIYSSTKYKAYPTFIGNRIYWQTNDNAPNYKLMLSTLEKPDFASAATLVPEGETVIEDYEVTSKWLLVIDKKDILSRIKVYTLDGKFVRDLALPETANIGSTSYHRESNTLYVSLSTFTAPSKLYKLNGETLEWTFFYQDKPPVDLSDIEANIMFIPSKDGTRIPAFVVHKKGLVMNGNNPVLIQGYGGFNNGIKPYFVGYASSFLKRGGVWVNTGIRGGDEYGEKWHQDGMLAKKQNSFDDFAAIAQWLIEKKYTNPKKIVAQGGSNGGLLMGAMATQHPSLFKAIVCQVPLLDMIRYHKFLIARFWIPEYGDPEKEADFAVIERYSPYHRISDGIELPTMLVTAGANDVRVDPLHAKKFVARAQSNPAQKNPVMLHIDYDSGHGSGKSLQQAIDDLIFTWNFTMGELGMK
ncbi:MAG: S9 family peptidase [Candidatus Kapabacteria bacterium]|nr:S9 family peptidase [Candidatus Kapabacteria bacterium]